MSLEALYETYSAVVRNRCRALLAFPPDVEDAVQEVFARAAFAQAAGSEAMDGYPVPWLLAVARNVCADMHRRRNRETRLGHRLRSERTAPQDPELHAISRLLFQEVSTTWSRGERRAALHRWLGDCTTNETARRMELSPSAVSTMLTRARRKALASVAET